MAEKLNPTDQDQAHLRARSPFTGYPPESGLDDEQARLLTFDRSHFTLELEEEARRKLLKGLAADIHVLFSRKQHSAHETAKPTGK